MITFKTIIILFSILVLMIILFRYFSRGKLYLTSYYNEQREIKASDETIKNQILKALKKSNFKTVKVQENLFSAITIPSIWSFSEIVNIEVKKVDETTFLINFNSKCLFPFQIFDWSKNQRNSSRFFKNIS
jgi:hypothetical protein